MSFEDFSVLENQTTHIFMRVGVEEESLPHAKEEGSQKQHSEFEGDKRED